MAGPCERACAQCSSVCYPGWLLSQIYESDWYCIDCLNGFIAEIQAATPIIATEDDYEQDWPNELHDIDNWGMDP